MTAPETSSFVVLYRWRIKSGSEDRFATAWAEATRSLLARGSLGSRLHKGSDGCWYGYAQWPNAQARTSAFAGDAMEDVVLRMRECVAESLPEIVLTPVSDFLQPLPTLATGKG
ncbi:MAG TPA: antibiotic biosynthesis monooxygenase [Luteimonas sp.]|nr:antibiotic biosynthesis monooxygenase [Luteimonas sp.]